MKETRPPITTPWRFCASCVVTLLCWTVWIVLGLLLGWQGYVALSKDVSVPDFVLRRLESSLAAENLYVRFGRAHFDPRGGILLEKVRLHSRFFEDPLLTSDFMYLRKSIWSVLAGQLLPDAVRLEGASLLLPAMHSPSGAAEPILREVDADFHFTDEVWSIERFTGRVGNMPVTIIGNTAPPRNKGGAPLSIAAITERYLEYARQTVQALPALQSASNPLLEIACTPRETGGMNLALSFFAEGIHRPGDKPVDLGPLSIDGQWQWDGLQSYPLLIQLSTEAISGEKFKITRFQSLLTLEPGTGKSLVARVHGQVSSSQLQVLGETLLTPVLEGSYSLERDELEASTAFNAHGRVLAFDGSVNLAQKSAFVHFAGTVEPSLVTSVLTRHGPKLEPYFRFGDPVTLDARLKINEGWRFGGVWSHALTGRLDSRGVAITSARGRVDVDADLNFLAHDAHVLAGTSEARGMYWMNFRSMDYRFLLAGRLRPPEISGWFRGNWWPDFWKNFSFAADSPFGDVDVLGNWRDGRNMTYFGSADAVKAGVLQADFDSIHTRIFLRSQFVHAMDIIGIRANGTQRTTGWFKRTGRSGPDTTSALDFDLTGNLDRPTVEKLGGETAVSLLAPFVLSQPPQLHLWGHTGRTNGNNENNLQFTGEMATPLSYYYFPLDRVKVAGDLHGDTLKLSQIDLSVAGGQGQGQVTLSGKSSERVLELAFKVKEADLARTIRAVEEFEAKRTGVKSESMTESKFIRRATGGKLELAINARGNPENPMRLKGEGTLQLTGAELAEINLFGLLSQLFSFSSLKLDAARSSFQMADGRVYFPDVRVTGKSALIDAKGSYFIDTKKLDFTAHLKPYEETSNPLIAVMGLVMNPLTKMFELQLTGPIANPNWTISLGNSTPKPPEPEKAAAPAPAPETPSR